MVYHYQFNLVAHTLLYHTKQHFTILSVNLLLQLKLQLALSFQLLSSNLSFLFLTVVVTTIIGYIGGGVGCVMKVLGISFGNLLAK